MAEIKGDSLYSFKNFSNNLNHFNKIKLLSTSDCLLELQSPIQKWDFNTATAHIRSDIPMRVQLAANVDRSYSYIIKPPETSWLVKKVINKEKLTQYAGHVVLDFIDVRYVYEIAKIKKELDIDFQRATLESICNCILGQCNSMGVAVSIVEETPLPFNPKAKV